MKMHAKYFFLKSRWPSGCHFDDISSIFLNVSSFNWNWVGNHVLKFCSKQCITSGYIQHVLSENDKMGGGLR